MLDLILLSEVKEIRSLEKAAELAIVLCRCQAAQIQVDVFHRLKAISIAASEHPVKHDLDNTGLWPGDKLCNLRILTESIRESLQNSSRVFVVDDVVRIVKIILVGTPPDQDEGSRIESNGRLAISNHR